MLGAFTKKLASKSSVSLFSIDKGAYMSMMAKKAGKYTAKKTALPLGYLGAGAAVNTYLEADERYQRSYMGDEAFEARFGSGYSTMMGVTTGLSYGLAAFSVFKKDPISAVGKRATAVGNLYKNRYKGPISSIGRRARDARRAAKKRENSVYSKSAEVSKPASKKKPIRKQKGYFESRVVPTALIGGAAYAGAYVGGEMPRYAASEGNITNATYNRAPTRMNFNTAGLVQSLHHNRKP